MIVGEIEVASPLEILAKFTIAVVAPASGAAKRLIMTRSPALTARLLISTGEDGNHWCEA
jgi:hypothetical protein